VAEDWRLTATLHDDRAHDVLDWLRGHEAEADARQRLGDAVAVSGDGDTVFAYADTREALTAAEQVIRGVLAEHRLGADLVVHRWHDLEERWEDESVPLPQTEAERQLERDRLEAADAAESEQTGRALWEVRLELPSHDETRELQQRLEREGFSVIARWTYLLVGADSEDDARELAERFRQEAPAGAVVQVEPSGEMVAQVTPANPFAIFGGLGT
jgi:hypothetical protein